MENERLKRYHLAISRADFEMAPEQYGCRIEETSPNYALFSSLFERVGEPWLWPYRNTHVNDVTYWQNLVADTNTRLFLYKNKEEVIGFCLAGNVRDEFTVVTNSLYNVDTTKEIIYTGLFIEHTNKGYGSFLVTSVLKNLFETCETVYLNTRSSNHSKVVPFYQKLGMSLIETEYLKPDIIDTPQRIKAQYETMPDILPIEKVA